AIAQCLPRRTFTLCPICLADSIADEGLLSAWIAASLEPFLGNARPGLQVTVRRPNIKRPMLAPGRCILCTPFEARQHLRTVMLLDYAAAGVAGEVRMLRVL